MTEMVVTSLFDPEIVIPSQESVVRLEFWLRLQEWTRDPRPRMSLQTSKQFNELLLSPPYIEGLPKGDFWTIVSKLAPRVHNEAADQNACCEAHVRELYAPFLGELGNIELLVDAISHSPKGRVTALATDERCWRDLISAAGCETCDAQNIMMQTSPDDDLALAFREQFLRFEPCSADSIREFAAQLFPQLTFSESAWSRLDTLGGDARIVVSNLILHLGVLNDFVVEIWNTQTTTVDRQSHLGALGVAASPESPSVRHSRTAMNIRTFEFDSEQVKCEWHTKLQPGRDRIYFAVQNGRAYVGAIIKHL